MRRRSIRTSTRPTRASWPPVRRPPSSVMTWNRPRVRPASLGQSKGRGAYEADDWNSGIGDGGGNCLGAEPGRRPKHESHTEGGREEEASDSNAAAAASQGQGAK